MSTPSWNLESPNATDRGTRTRWMAWMVDSERSHAESVTTATRAVRAASLLHDHVVDLGGLDRGEAGEDAEDPLRLVGVDVDADPRAAPCDDHRPAQVGHGAGQGLAIQAGPGEKALGAVAVRLVELGVGGREGRRLRDRQARPPPVGRSTVGEEALDAFEEEDEPQGAGVHDVVPGQHGELAGRVGDRLAGLHERRHHAARGSRGCAARAPRGSPPTRGSPTGSCPRRAGTGPAGPRRRPAAPRPRTRGS